MSDNYLQYNIPQLDRQHVQISSAVQGSGVAEGEEPRCNKAEQTRPKLEHVRCHILYPSVSLSLPIAPVIKDICMLRYPRAELYCTLHHRGGACQSKIEGQRPQYFLVPHTRSLAQICYLRGREDQKNVEQEKNSSEVKKLSSSANCGLCI